MTIQLRNGRLCTIPVRTRIPFRYGITTLYEAPYLIVEGEFSVDGKSQVGRAADVLAPKWFTKRPDFPLDQEIEELLDVVQQTGRTAMTVPASPSPFHWWQLLYRCQAMSLAETQSSWPPLLSGFGVSLWERAAIDAFCRARELTFPAALQANELGIELEKLHPSLAGTNPADWLPDPSRRMQVRHTVGLADLLGDDLDDQQRIGDGLPQTLRECVSAYGVRWLKVKLPADVATAARRLQAIHDVLAAEDSAAWADMRFTLDGNEAFSTAADFRAFWDELTRDATVQRMLPSLLAVEQPLHRDVALSDSVQAEWQDWPTRPRLIIDESDSQLDSLERALQTGYHGTSHKNCKGVFKSIANACLLRQLAQQSAETGEGPFILTGEDLMNLGPVALLQDLAVAACLGLEHVERNGHHFVAGLAHLSKPFQEGIHRAHGDLYHVHAMPPAGEAQATQPANTLSPSGDNGSFLALTIDEGQIALDSVLSAPFGYDCPIPTDAFHIEPL